MQSCVPICYLQLTACYNFRVAKTTLFLENTMADRPYRPMLTHEYNIFIIYKIIKRSCETKGIPGKHSSDGWQPIIVI